MSNPVWLWIWCVAAVVLLGAVASIVRRLGERKAALLEVEERRMQALMESEIDAGKRLADGRPACVICGVNEATVRLPVIGLSVFERLNPLRDLYGSPHLYRRVEDHFTEPNACATDRDLYASSLDAELAELRRLVANFSSTLDRRINDLRSGVMVASVREYVHADKRAPSVMLPRPLHPLLTAAEEVAFSAPQTTNGKRVDDQAEVAN